MKLLVNVLLYIFTAVSAYVTYTLTSSLANNLAETIAFSALGGAFDVLKCILPAFILSAAHFKKYDKALILSIIWLALTSWSFYASMNLFSTSQDRLITEATKTTIAYTTLEKQLSNLQKSYDELVALQRITKANEDYGDKMVTIGAQMTALITDALSSKEDSLKDQALSLVVSFLLEFSVLGCHIALALNAAKVHAPTAPKNTQKEVHEDTHASARDEHEQGLSEDSACTSASARAETKSARETVYKMSALELATLLKTNNDEGLSYRKITEKYGVKNTDTIRDAKAILLAEAKELEDAKAASEESTSKNDILSSNIILLPTMTK